MTTYDHSFGTAHSNIAARAVAWLSDALRAARNRRAFYRLGELSEIELHDIGLTRADLHAPAGLPLTADPTARLARVARQRIGRMETWAAYRA